MLEVNKIIIELLQTHDCVIFPNLGGFVAQYSPAKLNSINNTFTPPFKQILFNKNLTNNDGLLVNAIAQRHSISFQESNKKLSILLDKINNELDNSSKYLFEGIGMLFAEEQQASAQDLFEQFLDLLVIALGLVNQCQFVHHLDRPQVVFSDALLEQRQCLDQLFFRFIIRADGAIGAA